MCSKTPAALWHPSPTSMSLNTFCPPTTNLNPLPSPRYISPAGEALPLSLAKGKNRSGLHLFFASCYHFSHLHPPTHTPQPPPLLMFPDTPAPSFLPWSGAEWLNRCEGGTHARRRTFDPSTLWTFCCRLAACLNIQSCCFLDNTLSILCLQQHQRVVTGIYMRLSFKSFFSHFFQFCIKRTGDRQEAWLPAG